MRRTAPTTALFAVLATLALAGCAEDSLPTRLTTEVRTDFFRRAPAPGFDALRRTTPLVQEISVSGTIGKDGGRLEVPEAGIVFTVPAGALTEPVEITLRALPGTAMAFDFSPHGLEFRRPASIALRVRGTAAEALAERSRRDTVAGMPLADFLGVYFTGDPEAGVEPLENIETRLVGESIVFDVEHFSGYVCASG